MGPGSTPILGLEAVGTILEVGAEATGDFKAGERVMALCSGGTYAEQVDTTVALQSPALFACSPRSRPDCLFCFALLVLSLSHDIVGCLCWPHSLSTREGLEEAPFDVILHARQVVVDAGAVMRAPDSFSTHEAAAFMEATITAYLNIFTIGGAKKGSSVLIHGGGSGVGRQAYPGLPAWLL